MPRSKKLMSPEECEEEYGPKKGARKKSGCDPNSPKANDPEYICNPATGKWVLRRGSVGKKILASKKGSKRSSPKRSKRKSSRKRVKRSSRKSPPRRSKRKSSPKRVKRSSRKRPPRRSKRKSPPRRRSKRKSPPRRTSRRKSPPRRSARKVGNPGELDVRMAVYSGNDVVWKDIKQLGTYDEVGEYLEDDNEDVKTILSRMWFKRLMKEKALKAAFIEYMSKCVQKSYMGLLPDWFDVKPKFENARDDASFEKLFSSGCHILACYIKNKKTRAAGHLLTSKSRKEMEAVNQDQSDDAIVREMRKLVVFKSLSVLEEECDDYGRDVSIWTIVLDICNDANKNMIRGVSKLCPQEAKVFLTIVKLIMEAESGPYDYLTFKKLIQKGSEEDAISSMGSAPSVEDMKSEVSPSESDVSDKVTSALSSLSGASGASIRSGRSGASSVHDSQGLDLGSGGSGVSRRSGKSVRSSKTGSKTGSLVSDDSLLDLIPSDQKRRNAEMKKLEDEMKTGVESEDEDESEDTGPKDFPPESESDSDEEPEEPKPQFSPSVSPVLSKAAVSDPDSDSDDDMDMSSEDRRLLAEFNKRLNFGNARERYTGMTNKMYNRHVNSNTGYPQGGTGPIKGAYAFNMFPRRGLKGNHQRFGKDYRCVKSVKDVKKFGRDDFFFR